VVSLSDGRQERVFMSGVLVIWHERVKNMTEFLIEKKRRTQIRIF